jgi:hypothetical protein
MHLSRRLFSLVSVVCNLELARIGSLLFILVNSPSDQIGDEEPIDTFATGLSAEPLMQQKSLIWVMHPLPLEDRMNSLVALGLGNSGRAF